MPRLITLSVTTSALLSLSACPSTPKAATEAAAEALVYPTAERGDTVDTYHGVSVSDPYRWLEDPDSEATGTWIEAQNTLTHGWLDAVPERDLLTKRLEELWSYERFGTPVAAGERVFFTHNDGLQDQSVLMVADGLDGEPTTLIDPNTLSPDGTVAMASWTPSPDGSMLCYALSESGSDWRTWRVRDVATGQDRPDQVEWSKFSECTWAGDGSGFYYSRFPQPDDAKTSSLAFQQLMFHSLGTDQAADAVVADNPEQPQWGFYGELTDDGRILSVIITEGTGEQNRLWVRDLNRAKSGFLKLINEPDAAYTVIGHHDGALYLRTSWQAPTYRIMKVELAHPEREAWTEVVPASDDVIGDAQLAGDKLVLTRLHNAQSVVTIHGLDGAPLQTVALPGVGTVRGVSGEQGSPAAFYSYNSYTQPSSVYSLDLDTGESTAWKLPEVNFDPSLFETRQVWFTSDDGTRVPMFIVSLRGLELDGSHPTELYGYGGFAISLTPRFKVENIVWMENGGVMAVANLRGGGEFGEEWHLAGTKLDKQNVFDDFAGAARWLVDEGYATTDKLAIRGGSNGGLLVGASVTQHPELFGAAVAQVGVMDMLRYHSFTIGWAWADDYGRSDDSPEMFEALHAYSPVHNARPASYPPLLITTADHDDRVVPGHSFKFAAAMQHAQRGPDPMLIRVQTKAGHGAGMPTSMRIAEVVDRFSFYGRTLGMDWSALGTDSAQ